MSTGSDLRKRVEKARLLRQIETQPELLRVCHMGAEILQKVIERNDGPEAWPHLQEIVDQMNAAIAKAEGGLAASQE